jgi:DNA-binding NarL/FixJ family response regulator
MSEKHRQQDPPDSYEKIRLIPITAYSPRAYSNGDLLQGRWAMKRVYLVDDSDLVRRRLVDMLSELEDVEIVGQTGDPEEAQAEIRRLSPDVVVMDIKLPGKNGIEVLRDIKKEMSTPLVIMLTNYPYTQYRRECTDAGADHFLYKATEFEKINDILRQLPERGQPP